MPSTSAASSPGLTAGGLEPLSDALELPPIAFEGDSSSDWATESEDGSSPSGPSQPSPSSLPNAGKKRKRKAYPSDVAAKKSRRRRKRRREKEAMGPTALRVPTYGGVPEVAHTELQSEAHFPANRTGYSADRLESIRPDHLWTLRELDEIDLEVMPWDGKCVAFHPVAPCHLLTQCTGHPSPFSTTTGGSLPCS